MIRILLADDHTVVRESLATALRNSGDCLIVAESGDGISAIEKAHAVQPDVAVIDIAMPNLSGIEAAQRITTALPQTAVVILSMHKDESYVIRSLKAGARAYLLKDSAEADLIEAISAITEGKSFFSPAVRSLLKEDYMHQLDELGAEDSYELLTNREREVLQLVAEGKANKEIAGMLNLSLYTVETHRTHILQKLNLHSAPELILYAVRKGIIS